MRAYNESKSKIQMQKYCKRNSFDQLRKASLDLI